MSGHAFEYPSAYNIENNTWLTYDKPHDGKMYLFVLPISAMKRFGIKKPIEVVAHWALCINGICYELRRTGKKDYDFVSTTEPKFVERRDEQKKPILCKELGYTAGPYTHGLIEEVGKYPVHFTRRLKSSKHVLIDALGGTATLVWERSLKKKYAYDEYNCQVFIRLLIELIGDQNAKVEFPQFLDQWVRGAGNTRDGGFFAFTAGAILIAAGATFMGADGGATAAAGFAIAAGTTLRSATWLLTERDNRSKKIKEGQKDIREEMQRRGRPLLLA